MTTVTLTDIERYYDAVPRPVARTEEVGPFTLFRAEEGTGWQWYARPRLGLTGQVSASDVRRMLDRQVELGLPRAIEWVHQTTPSLLPAAREATEGVAGVEIEECPLLVLPPDARVPEAPNTRALDGDDPDLALTQSVIHAGFDGTDELADRPLGRRPELIRYGLLVVVAAYDGDRVVAGGSAAPRGDAAELMGIAVPPAFRRQGLGSAVTRGLVHAVRDRGVRLVLLSAASDDAASIYRQVGFVDVGTACILGISDGD